MNKSYNSKLDVSSHPIPQQIQVPEKEDDDNIRFDPQQILHQISTQKDISIPMLQSEMKEIKLSLNQLILQLGRVKKDVSIRPTVSNMMQNTIILTSMIQADPNIMKLLKSKQDNMKSQKLIDKTQNQPQQNANAQLKQLSTKLGTKLSSINEGLSILYSMFKQLQKSTQTDLSQLRSFLQQKTHSIQDQINLMKIQEISERTSLTEKLQAQFQTSQQKLRLIETKFSWQIKQLKTKLNEKLEKSTFQTAIDQTLLESKKMFKDFCQSSNQLINPQKIQELQSIIKENKQKFIKDITECHLKVDMISSKMTQQLVGLQFYKKQRTSIQKRLSNININFSQMHEKVTTLIKDSSDHQNRLNNLQQQMTEKTKTMKQMRSILRSLSITEQFQQMLSKIDPQKILIFQSKIMSLQDENKHIYKMFSHLDEQIDKINSKFDISGVLVPNKSRQKQYQLNDLREIIDEYFVENRFANKISKLQNDINDGRSSVDAIKLLQKKVSRLQKQNSYSKIVQQFNLLEEKLMKKMKILQQKMQTKISQTQVQKSYLQELIAGSTTKQKPINNTEESEQLRRKLLLSESRSRIIQRQSNFQQRSSSFRKISSWESSSNLNTKNALNNNRIVKNTISSVRKSLLTSNNLMLGS